MADLEAETPVADPVKAVYDVYIKPQISQGRQVYILQFPNRNSNQPYSAKGNTQPLKLRVKPAAGMVELDVPVDVWRNYDRSKGIKWGDAMKKSKAMKGDGGHGMPAGFGIGGANNAARHRGRGEVEEEVDQEKLLRDYQATVQREQVLTKQTLGGQTVMSENTTPQYMLGTFRGDQLHLSPVDHIVQMRPQFHHIDAHYEQDRQGRIRDMGNMQKPMEARAVLQTVKNTVDGEEDNGDDMHKRIADTQSEAWRHHQFIDEEANEAWTAFYSHLFVGGQEEEAAPDAPKNTAPDVPKLLSALDNREYLDTISAPRDAAKLSRSKKVSSSRADGKGKGKDVAGDEDESDSSSDNDVVMELDPV